VIAAGAIYVLGGRDATTYYNDVYVSTDGGADRTQGYSRGTTVTHEVLGGVEGVPRGYSGVLEVYTEGTHGVLKRC
jgi:hypothetical protein